MVGSRRGSALLRGKETMGIEENIRAIRQRIDQAALAAGRRPEEITLCAATKMNDAAAVRRAIAAGVDCCGENRVQELTRKLSEGAYRGAPVHFIGRLQTNKVRQVVGKVNLIQSVDRENLLEALEKEAARQQIQQRILLQVNIGREETKAGFDVCQIPQVLEKMGQFPHLLVKGLMAIPPAAREERRNFEFFQEMCNLSVDIRRKKYDNVEVEILSMGMSEDFADAIACGSTMIRIGTAIFGQRR
jgi:pyridoxal phosphate enzyme (YggS family)